MHMRIAAFTKDLKSNVKQSTNGQISSVGNGSRLRISKYLHIIISLC
jgi:hypothetical protein